MSTVYLLGKPVGHSLSPALHNAAFAALGLPHRYRTLEVDEAQLRATLVRFRSEDVLGANVTIPYKEAVTELLDEMGDEARRIGAVNTIVRRGSRLSGENTDAYGFVRALEEPVHAGAASNGGARLQGGTVLLLGAGGAARACAHALLARGNDVLVANRSGARARELARAVEVGGRRPRVVRWPTADDLRGVDGVVNATPLGMRGEDPLAGLDLPAVVVDIVPTAEETPLVKRARATDYVTVVDGLSMLLHQAARSFALWTGLEPPLAVMRAALPRPV